MHTLIFAAKAPSFGTVAPKFDWDETRARLSGRSILIVEDEAIVGMEIAMLIEDANARPIGPVMSLEEAVAVGRNDMIDAAILDVDLNGRDVFPAAELLAERGIPFLFHTGHMTRPDLSERFSDVPICNKPMIVEHLLAHLAELMGTKEPSQ